MRSGKLRHREAEGHAQRVAKYVNKAQALDPKVFCLHLNVISLGKGADQAGQRWTGEAPAARASHLSPPPTPSPEPCSPWATLGQQQS